jgi:hypothetical protein
LNATGQFVIVEGAIHQNGSARFGHCYVLSGTDLASISTGGNHSSLLTLSQFQALFRSPSVSPFPFPPPSARSSSEKSRSSWRLAPSAPIHPPSASIPTSLA